MKRAVWLLNDELRVAILVMLVSGRQCVGDLTERLGWLQSQVSDGLLEFKASGWVECVQSGRNRIYWLSGTPSVRVEGAQLIIELDAEGGDKLHMVRTCVLAARSEPKPGSNGHGEAIVRLIRADSVNPTPL